MKIPVEYGGILAHLRLNPLGEWGQSDSDRKLNDELKLQGGSSLMYLMSFCENDVSNDIWMF